MMILTTGMSEDIIEIERKYVSHKKRYVNQNLQFAVREKCEFFEWKHFGPETRFLYEASDGNLSTARN
jgi:hypothetical protein